MDHGCFPSPRPFLWNRISSWRPIATRTVSGWDWGSSSGANPILLPSLRSTASPFSRQPVIFGGSSVERSHSTQIITPPRGFTKSLVMVAPFSVILTQCLCGPALSPEVQADAHEFCAPMMAGFTQGRAGSQVSRLLFEQNCRATVPLTAGDRRWLGRIDRL